MSKRWISGVLIFALGFASPSLVTNAMAQEPHEESGVLEEGLGYVMTETGVKLVNSGRYVYLVMVQRELATSPAEAPISYVDGTMKLSKYSLSKAIAYRLEPVAFMEQDFWRPCSMGDCSFIGPLPPPPPPTDLPDPSAVLLTPQ